ncbi:glycerophosphodiester phosphodiesterase family protein [bacterium]|nr:glycerophosphodiester phosphodiesterase family protein [bacterium]
MRIMASIAFLLASVISAPSAFCTGACAHRGDTMSAPENTLPAIVSAVRKGAHQIEIDAQLSLDGKLVLMHDGTVDRTTDGTGKVSDLTFEKLRTLDAGSWYKPEFKGTKIPELREALEAIPHEILCNIHVKGGSETTVPVARLVSDLGRLDHCFISIGGSEAQEAMAAARASVPGIKLCTGFVIDKEPVTEKITGIDKDVLEKYRKLNPGKEINGHIDIIQLVYWVTPIPKDVVEKSVSILHRYDVKANYCCASEAEPLRTLIGAGADYILTDNLDLCLKTLNEYGTKPVDTSKVKK